MAPRASRTAAPPTARARSGGSVGRADRGGDRSDPTLAAGRRLALPGLAGPTRGKTAASTSPAQWPEATSVQRWRSAPTRIPGKSGVGRGPAGAGALGLDRPSRRAGSRVYAHADDRRDLGAAALSEGSHLPSLVLDKDGGLHLAWASPLLYVYHTHYVSSKDGGDTFGQEGMLNNGGASVSVYPPLTAIAAGTDGTVYVAFVTHSPRDGTVLHYDRAKNGAFGHDVTLAGDKGSPTPSQPAMTGDTRGRVFVAWGEFASGAFQVYLARAETGGEFSSKGKVVGGETGIAAADGESKTTPVPAALPPEVRLLDAWQYSPLATGNLAVDKTDNLWMNLAGEPEIQHLTTDGQILLKFGNFRPMGPFDIAVDGRNDIYVLLQQGQGLQKFSAEGKFLLAWDDDRLGWGYAIAIDALR